MRTSLGTNEYDEENTTIPDAGDGLSLAEKMQLFWTEKPEISDLGQAVAMDEIKRFKEEGIEEDFEDYAISHYPDAWKFLTTGHSYQWLIGRLKSEILLTDRTDTVVDDIHRKITQTLISWNIKQIYTINKVKFEISWELLSFLKEHYPQEQHVNIGSVITITESGPDTQALTCAEYMRQVWPVTGMETLNALQELLTIGVGNSYRCNPDPR